MRIVARNAGKLRSALDRCSKNDTKSSTDELGREIGLGTRVAENFWKCGLDEPIPELHGYFIEPMKFDS